MSLLAANGWDWCRGPITTGTLFLILGWASLHGIKNQAVVAVYGLLLVPIPYESYEQAKSPLTPQILWFVSLVG